MLRAKVRRPQLLHLMVTRLGMHDQRSPPPRWTTAAPTPGGSSLSAYGGVSRISVELPNEDRISTGKIRSKSGSQA